MTGKVATAAWLAIYHSDLLGRELTPPERMLAEEVLLDFLLEEPAFDHRSAGDDVQHALELIQGLAGEGHAPAAARLSASITAAVAELEGRLARQEHANMIMREHLTMLSRPPESGAGSANLQPEPTGPD